MNLMFLAPLFLAGAAAIAIPILVHLTHRERRETVKFPSLMFLRRVPFRTVRRQRIRHWPLLLLRVAAIALVAAAFARPLWDRGTIGPATLGSAREVVVLLDRSYSMGYGDRWAQASTAAHQTIDGIAPDDRVTLVLFTDHAEAVNLPTADRDALHAIVDRTRPSSAGTRFGPALELVRDILDASDLPRREAVLITDFQRHGWDAQVDVRMPEGTAITPIDVGAADASNVAVAGVLFDQSREAARPRLTLSARIVNPGPTASIGRTVRLEIEGQAVQQRTVDLPAGSAETVRFDPAPLPDRPTRGIVRLDPDDLPEDDVFRFTVSPPRPVPIVVVRHPSAPANDLLYLRQALALGSDPAFDIRVRSATQLASADLDGIGMVVLFDAPYPRGAVGRTLDRFVRDGGGLLVVLGPRTGDGMWTGETTASLGTVSGQITDRLGGRGGTVSVLDYSHPVFEPFGAPRSGDFSTARFFRYRQYEAPVGATVLARFDDGAPALVEIRVGDGAVMVWTSDATNRWNDLPLQPIFLPFVHQAARHLAGYRPRPAFHVAGRVVDIGTHLSDRPWGPRQRPDTEAELVLETPSGGRDVLGPTEAGRPVALGESGFYVVRPLAAGAGVETAVLAVNPDVAEADLERLDPEQLLGAIAPRGGGAERAASLAAALTPVEKERRQGLWWYLVGGALLLLLAETGLASRLSRLAS